jgi:hypothetical protein
MNMASTLSNMNSDAAKTAVFADNLGLDAAQTQALLDKITAELRAMQIQREAKVFVSNNPRHVLSFKMPGLITGKCEGVLSDNEKKQKCKRLMQVYNMMKNKKSELTQIAAEDEDDFLTYGFLSQPDHIDTVLYGAYSQPGTRRMLLDACRYMSKLILCCSDNQDNRSELEKRIENYTRLITKIDHAPVDPLHKGTRDGKRTRTDYENMSVDDADVHIADVQYNAKNLKIFIDPLLAKMYDEAKQMSPAKVYTNSLSRKHAYNGHTKTLGKWVQQYIMLASKHGITNKDELRTLRTGDWGNIQVAKSTTDLGQGSWIVEHPDKQLFLHVICTKVKTALPPIPLHKRCRKLASFLRNKWMPTMKVYQNTEVPYLLCTIVKEPSKRTKYTSNAVECLNREVFRVAEMRATTNLSRHADEIKTRTGLTHVAESGHGPKQAIAYQDATVNGGRGREPIESMQESLDNEQSESGDEDVVPDWDQFRCPAPGGWDQ